MPARPGPTPATHDPVTAIKGIGPKAGERLARLGAHTVGDLLHLLPRTYRDRRIVTPIAELPEDDEAVVAGLIRSVRVRRSRRGRILELKVEDGSDTLVALWFRAPVFMTRLYRPGMQVRMAGRLEPDKRVPTFYHPEMDDSGDGARILPVYGTTEGVSARSVGGWVSRALDASLDQVGDHVPADVRERLGLPTRREALSLLHRPPPDADLDALLDGSTAAHRAMLFSELFGMQLALALRRSAVKSAAAVPVERSRALVDRAISALPFTLTGAQRRAVDEILEDLFSGRPTCRMVQGDVGCGKTVVAMLAALPVLESGHQVALMVPTEVLADQHLRSAAEVFEPLGYDAVYLGGSLRARPRRDALERIASGTARVVIGTQALFQQGVTFADLGLAVVDEQHRFGVQQRADLASKGVYPHVLAMTATPIPRSLAMALYGDLDLSVIDELPPRGEVTTEVVGEPDRARVYDEVRAAVGRGERAFVVHALVESSDKLEDVRDAVGMSQALAEGPLRGLRVGLLHGRMDPMEKESVVEAFRTGEIQVLATTTVVEVGIDVPEASVMVIEDADRFGLAQLHQLRGRIGRSEAPGRCYLFCRRGGAHPRLRILARSRDGFEIAEADLRHRGPGDLLGTLQAGRPGFQIPTTARFSQILADAQREAFALVRRPDFETAPELEPLRVQVRERWGRSFRLLA